MTNKYLSDFKNRMTSAGRVSRESTFQKLQNAYTYKDQASPTQNAGSTMASQLTQASTVANSASQLGHTPNIFQQIQSQQNRRVVEESEDESRSKVAAEQNYQSHPVADLGAASDDEDSSSLNSNSTSGESSIKKRLEKEKMKRIEALKNELLRRQKEKTMTEEERKTFLTELVNKQKQENLNIPTSHIIQEISTYEQDKQTREEARKLRERRLEIMKRSKEQEELEAEAQRKRKQNKLNKAQSPQKKPQTKKSEGPSENIAQINPEHQKKPVQRPPQPRPATNQHKQGSYDFNYQDFIVDEFAQRCYYVLPTYPPEDFDYNPELEKQKLNLVNSEIFQKLKYFKPNEESKSLSQEDKELAPYCKDGLIPVIAVDFYTGLFRTTDGRVFDLRPNTEEIIKPSLTTFYSMPRQQLQKLLLSAYQNQLKELLLPDHDPYDRGYEQQDLIPELQKKIGILSKFVA